MYVGCECARTRHNYVLDIFLGVETIPTSFPSTDFIIHSDNTAYTLCPWGQNTWRMAWKKLCKKLYVFFFFAVGWLSSLRCSPISVLIWLLFMCARTLGSCITVELHVNSAMASSVSGSMCTMAWLLVLPVRPSYVVGQPIVVMWWKMRSRLVASQSR